MILARGATTPPGGAFSQISAGWNHSCALRTNKTVDCWGNYGQNWAADASGTYLQVDAGMQHTCAIDSVTLNADCWGDNKDGRATDYPGPFKQNSAGGYHNCGVKTDNTVVCWGRTTTGRPRRRPVPTSRRSPRARCTPAASRPTETSPAGGTTSTGRWEGAGHRDVEANHIRPGPFVRHRR